MQKKPTKSKCKDKKILVQPVKLVTKNRKQFDKIFIKTNSFSI